MPCIPTPEQVACIIAAPPELKYRTALGVTCSVALRAPETARPRWVALSIERHVS